MLVNVYICIGVWNPMMSHPYYAMSVPPAMPFLGPKLGLSHATSETTGYASAMSLGPGGAFPREAVSAAQVPIGGAKKRKNSVGYGPLPIPAASYGPPVKKALVPSDLPPPPMTVHITPPLAFNPALSSVPASYNLLPTHHPKPITSPTAKLSKQQSPTRLATTTTKTPKTKRTHHPHTTIHTPQDSQAGAAAAGLSDEDAASSLLGFYQQLKSSSSDSGSDTGPDGGGSDAGGSE